jgi:subtilisin family serine protease
MNVLSIIGGKIDGTFMGTAPEADFWLLRTEDAGSEYPIEADYWICAAEFADSAGVDIINTSLGYSEFDDSSLNYTYSQLDGNTVRISKAADIASATGMIVVTSAGNEGNKSWHYITAPADAIGVITVGAMTSDSIKASFSSFGPTADGRIKPDLTAMGVSNAIQLTSGGIGTGSGTSFSAPVITGLMACLWQSMKDMTAKNMKDLILESCNYYSSPDNSMGYGIPDFKTAYHTSSKNHIRINNDKWKVYPNPFVNDLVLTTQENIIVDKVEVSLYDITGRLKYKETVSASPKIYLNIPSHLTGGMYILHIKENDVISQYKLMRNP